MGPEASRGEPLGAASMWLRFILRPSSPDPDCRERSCPRLSGARRSRCLHARAMPRDAGASPPSCPWRWGRPPRGEGSTRDFRVHPCHAVSGHICGLTLGSFTASISLRIARTLYITSKKATTSFHFSCRDIKHSYLRLFLTRECTPLNMCFTRNPSPLEMLTPPTK